MKQFSNPIALAILLTSVLSRHVKCIANSKTGSSSISSSSTDGSQQLKDLKPDGTSFWSPQPEYYHERYNRPDRTDFVTSYGSHENKYGGSLSPSYTNKDRLGYTPFSTTGSGASSYYTPGGIFDRKQPHYGPAQPVDYPSAYGHDYENHYEYNQYNPHGQGYSLGGHHGGKDITKSVLIPLAGAALLGIAAALVANPVLLHLGAFAAGKRKRRDLSVNAHNLAYRAQLMKTSAASS